MILGRDYSILDQETANWIEQILKLDSGQELPGLVSNDFMMIQDPKGQVYIWTGQVAELYVVLGCLIMFEDVLAH